LLSSSSANAFSKNATILVFVPSGIPSRFSTSEISFSITSLGVVGPGGGGFTVTVNYSGPPTLPASSVAVHCTSVSPIGNSDPEGGSHEIVMSPPTSSCVIVLPSSSNVAFLIREK
jgi:hypothetical protein